MCSSNFPLHNVTIHNSIGKSLYWDNTKISVLRYFRGNPFQKPEFMLRLLVNRIFLFLFPDSSRELGESFRYKLLIVVLVLFMISAAAFTLLFFN